MATNTKLEKFVELTKMPYRDQAVWFLNGFWGEGIDPNEANKVWTYVEKFVALDLQSSGKKGTAGNELDQFWSAKFLEDFNQALSAIARKEALRQIVTNNRGMMSCIEFLVWTYKKTVNATVDAPQGTSQDLVDAQKALRKVQTALDECKRLEAELHQAVAELKKQEDAYNNRCQLLEQRANDAAASVVSRNKASNELAQLKGEDPLPLRKAKLTQEAALRKVQRQQDNLMKELAAAQEAVDRAKAHGGGTAPGLIWWLQRELFASDYYLPKSKQKFDHTKPFSYDPTA
eukprot:TRINITY_DN5489_c0_g1_i1.p1 TRINITY_DN5489_c0_g1~~TRINITY_DN5489_c0_g1_i1.p1  ORF type:complete len:289 (+),score=113.70 TRINITY_DN5489_c0_g1_i1:80-946(+)